MPSIEIICVRQNKPVVFRKVPFAVMSAGSIYRLGCPHFRGGRAKVFEAYELLSRKCRDQWPQALFLEFGRNFVPGIRNMMRVLLKQSPSGSVIFKSEYRFSPNRTNRITNISLRKFWELHRARRLRFNTLYTITGE